MKISVIGLGKLGAPLAAVLAHQGHTVIGLDQDLRPVSLINEGKTPVFEPELESLIQASHDRLSATTEYEKAVLETEVSFIVVPTPSQPNGRFSIRFVLEAAESIGAVLAQKQEFHLVVLTSTVMPGDTEGKVLPALERSSGRQCGRDFGLCYNPEFIALGNAIKGTLRPDFILIGESDSRSGGLLAQLHQGVCENHPPIARMNFINAELTKLAVNSFVTMKISYANLLAQVCERLAGADVDQVTQALGLDPRIGSRYLKGALGYGGPCFPRDNIAFSLLARELGLEGLLVEATDRFNQLQVPRLAELVLRNLPEQGKVGILGLTYKPDTEVIEEAPGFELARYLLSREISSVLYDPKGLGRAKALLNGSVQFAASAEECIQASDVIVLATPWKEFRSISPQSFERTGSRRVLIDCWRLFDRAKYEHHVDYIALGVGKTPSLSVNQKEIPRVAQV